jgi:hypothetical protein
MKTKLLKTAYCYCLLLLFATDLNAQRLSRELNVDLLINQAGYVPGAGKTVVTKGLLNRNYEVIRLEDQQVVFEGYFTPNTCDFGDYSVGDFSALTQEGHYYIKSDTLRSWPFQISKTVYRSPMNMMVGYFSLQRCGASTTGYLSPCHLDDGVRLDNGKHQDVTGGWHDASDLRKWVGATIYGMIGLSRTYELLDENDPGREKIYDELLWGNRYFLNMQEPAGYVMKHIGGEVKKNFDSNRWTDNEIGEEGGELHFAQPTAGALALVDEDYTEVLIFGSKDDRIIETKPADLISQYNFVTSEAAMARIAKNIDPAYSDKCLRAAINCFAWCQSTDTVAKTGVIGSSMLAAIELYKTTGQDVYRDFSVQKASLLKRLQAAGRDDSAGGFFYISFSRHEPYKSSFQVHLELIALCDLIQTFPRHGDVTMWKEMITDYCVHYLSFFSQRNSFGIVPYGLFSVEDPGGNRKVDHYWYRYFMPSYPLDRWFVGVNPHIASAGIGLMKAASILDDPKLRAIAQRQLDWIIGFNPFSSSTIVGVGHNQLKHMSGTAAFSPGIPVLPGAVNNGLCGNREDQPYLIPYDTYNDREYWTPAVAHTLWLMAEISR